jgi:flagellar hook-associated protein 1 FlgK
MSLTAAFQIGRSALNASSLALQVTGNNLANAATRGYSRQLVGMSGVGDSRLGGFLTGGGVRVTGINRQIDAALQARHWAGLSAEANAGVDMQVLSQLESTLNELTDNDLSSEFDRFFDAWSELANSPNSDGTRSLVVQQGSTLASSIRRMRTELTGMRTQIDNQLTSTVQQADSLLNQIADINGEILHAEGGGTGGDANNLRDQRDQLVAQLSTLMDVSVVEQPSGTIDVLVGSTPLVLGTTNRGIEAHRETNGDQLEISVRVRDDQTGLEITSGAIAGYLGQRDAAIDDTIEKLDAVASQLIYQVNRVHSSGRGPEAFTSMRGEFRVPSAFQGLAFNDPANETFAELPFAPQSGGFYVTVTNSATGESQSVRINVDLDRIDNSGAAGFGDDTSVNSLAADLGGVSNLTASVNPDGTLNIQAADGYTFEFSEDTSGALAALGVNTYFTGTGSSDIGVRQSLIDNPRLLAHGKMVDGQFTDNGAALAVVGVRDLAVGALNGRSITASWLDAASSVGSRADAAGNRADATTLVRQSLEAQAASVSGVSVDEESINLLNFQRQYQGAARFITVIDQLTQELMAIV